MTKYFLSIVNQELVQRASNVRDFLDEVQNVFPSSLHVKAHRALIHYHARGTFPLESGLIIEFDEAEEMFDGIVETDPFRLDDLDVYSNILYVMEKSSKLAYLAQLATNTDKYRVETCCIVGISSLLSDLSYFLILFIPFIPPNPVSSPISTSLIYNLYI
jgi:anaphase-promoting complex subunit 8